MSFWRAWISFWSFRGPILNPPGGVSGLPNDYFGATNMRSNHHIYPVTTPLHYRRSGPGGMRVAIRRPLALARGTACWTGAASSHLQALQPLAQLLPLAQSSRQDLSPLLGSSPPACAFRRTAFLLAPLLTFGRFFRNFFSHHFRTCFWSAF